MDVLARDVPVYWHMVEQVVGLSLDPFSKPHTTEEIVLTVGVTDLLESLLRHG